MKKINFNINRKAMLSTASLLLMVAIIVIATCFQAGIDPAKWFEKNFISVILITGAICVFGLLAGFAKGDNYYRTKQDGLYQTTYNGYNKSRDEMNPNVDKFTDWNNNLYEKEYTDKIMRYLKDKGIKQAELILQLDRTQIKEMTEPRQFIIDGKEHYFRSLSEEQIEAVINVLDGKIKLKFVHESYFLNAYSKNKQKSMYEQAGEQEETKRRKFTILILYRLSSTFALTLIIGGLTTDKLQGTSTEQIILNLVVRLFSLAFATLWGYFIASEMIKDECVFLDYKKRTLDVFMLDIQNKKFIYKSEDEKAKAEYEKRQAEIEEEKRKQKEKEVEVEVVDFEKDMEWNKTIAIENK